jgi:hypothetical protein
LSRGNGKGKQEEADMPSPEYQTKENRKMANKN